MKKKMISFMLSVVLAAAMVGCGSKSETETGSAAAEKSASEEAEVKDTDASGTEAEDSDAAAAADTVVYYNGNIYTANEEQEYVSAVVIQDGKFVYVGDDEGAEAYEEGLPEENIIDLEGQLTTPGFIEGHTHFTFMSAMKSIGYEEMEGNNNSLEKSLDNLKTFIEKHPDYDVYALGNFSQGFDLDKTQLDAICSDKPVICVGMGLHCGYVNSAFLEAGDITAETKDAVPGQSYYQRDADGNPTGKIVELTQTWIAFQQAIGSKLDNEKVKEEILNMQDLYHSYGFIGYAEGGYLGLDEEQMLEDYKELEEDGSLEMVVCPASIWYGSNVTPLSEIEERAVKAKTEYTTDLIRPGTVKMWADGTIGALSALMTENYTIDGVDKGTSGVQLNTVEDLTDCAEMCKENDLNIHYHAIGNQAIANVLTAFETVGETSGTKSVVHFTISTPELIERASKIDDLIINMTPIWGNKETPEEITPVDRYRECYGLFKEAMDAGITVNFGADSNGKEFCWNPVLMILAATNRNPDKEGYYLKGEACTLEEGIDAYTINVAKERRIDDEYGSIEVGKNACMDVWNVENLTAELYESYVKQQLPLTDKDFLSADKVIFNGKLVYDDEAAK